MHPRPAHRVGQPALTHDHERLTGGQRGDEPVDRLARLERADEQEVPVGQAMATPRGLDRRRLAAGPGSPGPAGTTHTRAGSSPKRSRARRAVSSEAASTRTARRASARGRASLCQTRS